MQLVVCVCVCVCFLFPKHGNVEREGKISVHYIAWLPLLLRLVESSASGWLWFPLAVKLNREIAVRYTEWLQQSKISCQVTVCGDLCPTERWKRKLMYFYLCSFKGLDHDFTFKSLTNECNVTNDNYHPCVYARFQRLWVSSRLDYGTGKEIVRGWVEWEGCSVVGNEKDEWNEPLMDWMNKWNYDWVIHFQKKRYNWGGNLSKGTT